MLEELGFVWRVERGGRPRGSYKGLRRTRYRRSGCDGGGGGVVDVDGRNGDDARAFDDDDDAGGDEDDEGIFDAIDFEGYMIARSREYTDEDVRDAWRRRFEYFR